MAIKIKNSTIIDDNRNIIGVGFVGIGTTSTDQLFQVGTASSIVIIDSMGDLGIGTTNPTSRLQVVPISTGIAGLFSGTTSSDMVRITQLGTGNALVVEDETNPDASPFVVTGIGSVGIGTTNPKSKLQVSGDINIDDGGTFTTVLQVVTPTANRTISLPDRTGTVALVAGSDSQITFNSAGINSGAQGFNWSNVNGLTATLPIINSYTGLANTSAVYLSGSWSSATGSKPQFLIEPSGTTSSGWGNAGTALGLNSPSGFTGNYVDIKKNGTSYLIVTGTGTTTIINSALNTLSLQTNSLDRVAITTSGDVGVGTTNPTSRLQVVPISTGIAGLFSGTTSSDMVRITQLGTGNALVVEDETNPDASPFVVTGIGSVGIGIANPTTKLQVWGNGKFGSTSAAGKIGLLQTNGNENAYIECSVNSELTLSGYDGVFLQNARGATLTPINSTSGLQFLTWNRPVYFDGYGGFGGDVIMRDFLNNVEIFHAYMGDGTGGSPRKITFTNAPVLIGTATSTGTASQPLQVTGGAYVSGNLGIGTTNPTSKLHVVGNVLITGITTLGVTSVTNLTAQNINVSGITTTGTLNVGVGGTIITTTGIGSVGIGTTNPQYTLQVVGSFGAITKSFIIPHPTKPNYKLRYGSLESPYHGIRLTGIGTIKNGQSTVNLPDYISALVRNEEINIQITNIKHGKILWVEDVDVENNKFVIMAEEKSGQYNFYWDFTAIRNDVEKIVVEYEDL